MAKQTYEKVGWQNESTGNTPVSAENLEHMDSALKYLYDEGATSKDIFICNDGQTIDDAPEDAKIVFENSSINTKASEVVNSMDGNETDKSPSVNAVKNYVDEKNTYSTDEAVIGTWIDRKPIYRKVVSVSNTEISVNTSIPTGITNLEDLISLKGIYKNNDSGVIATYPLTQNTGTILGCVYYQGNIGFIGNESYTKAPGRTHIFTLEYTKTAD